jgi:hypothetical protein
MSAPDLVLVLGLVLLIAATFVFGVLKINSQFVKSNSQFATELRQITESHNHTIDRVTRAEERRYGRHSR